MRSCLRSSSGALGSIWLQLPEWGHRKNYRSRWLRPWFSSRWLRPWLSSRWLRPWFSSRWLRPWFSSRWLRPWFSPWWPRPWFSSRWLRPWFSSRWLRPDLVLDDWGHDLVLDDVWRYGGRIQLLLKRLPDSSVSSVILAGWCQEEHPVTKTLLQYSQG